jgi:DNA repair exonuclease SbcCD ATPase subunit
LIAAAAWYFHENPESSDAGKSLASKLTEKLTDKTGDKPSVEQAAPFIQSFRKIENVLDTARQNRAKNKDNLHQQLQAAVTRLANLIPLINQIQPFDEQRLRYAAREVDSAYKNIAKAAKRFQETYQKDMQAVKAQANDFKALEAALRQFRGESENYETAEALADFLEKELIPYLQARHESAQNGSEEYAPFLDAIVRVSAIHEKTFSLVTDTLSIVLKDPELHGYLPEVLRYLEQMKSGLKSLCRQIQEPASEGVDYCPG